MISCTYSCHLQSALTPWAKLSRFSNIILCSGGSSGQVYKVKRGKTFDVRISSPHSCTGRWFSGAIPIPGPQIVKQKGKKQLRNTFKSWERNGRRKVLAIWKLKEVPRKSRFWGKLRKALHCPEPRPASLVKPRNKPPRQSSKLPPPPPLIWLLKSPWAKRNAGSGSTPTSFWGVERAMKKGQGQPARKANR